MQTATQNSLIALFYQAQIQLFYHLLDTTAIATTYKRIATSNYLTTWLTLYQVIFTITQSMKLPEIEIRKMRKVAAFCFNFYQFPPQSCTVSGGNSC
jgi:hypothetical protein